MAKIIIRQKNNPTCTSGVLMTYPNAGVISIMHQPALQVLDLVKLHFRLLAINETISMRLKFNIESGNCGGDCTDLTLTLSRGQEEIDQFVQSADSVNNGNDFTTQWDILVDDSVRTWDKDTMLTLTVEYSVPAQGGPQCTDPPGPVGPIADCSGNFRMYYSEDGGSPGDVYAEFPIYVSLTDASNNVPS